MKPEHFLPLTPLTHAILLALLDEARHGYAIIKEVERITAGTVRPATGTLYAALQRMQEDGLITHPGRPVAPTDDPRRRYYRMTRLGRAVALAESRRLARALQVASDKALLPTVDLADLYSEGEA